MMRRAMPLVILGLLAGACGPVRMNDPLGGLGGPADTARFSFESGADGWAKPADASSTISVFQTQGRSLYGTASLAVAVQGMGATNGSAARASVLMGSPADMAGKTVQAWLYAPSAAQESGSVPSYAQIYLKDGANHYSNSVGANINADNWVLIQFSPVANPSGVSVTTGGAYYDAGFDPTNIKELGIKVQASGSASPSFTFDGVLLIDSVTW